MSDASTIRMLRAYEEQLQAPMFLSSFFQTPAENFHRSEKVEIDIVRSNNAVAIPLPSVRSQPREYTWDQYTNKEITPPIYDTAATISAYEGLMRRAGRTPFESPEFLRDAVQESFRAFNGLEALIRRAVELQASQVLLSGTVDLVDAGGHSIHTENFHPKTTHHVTVSTAWTTAGGGDPIADLTNLARVIRNDGKSNPDVLIMGSTAFEAFLSNDKVDKRLNNRRIEVGEISPVRRGSGATQYGHIWLDSYRFEIWLYDGVYAHPQTGAVTPYVPADKVIMLSSDGRLDLTYGALPMFVPPEARAMQFLPSRFSYRDAAMDLSVNSWLTPDGKHLKVSAGTRPLCIPTAIDTYGTLDVTP